MHTLLVLSDLLLVVLVGFLELTLLRHLGQWTGRRDVPLLVLALPVTMLGLGISELYHFLSRPCFWVVASWDELLAGALVLGVEAVAFGALALGLTRLALMAWVVARKATLPSPTLQALIERLAARRGIMAPCVRLCPYNQPLAFTQGLRRPVILLSTWMVDHLDRQELEAVLAHELEHVARRDYLVIWLATMLRDAFCYVPTSWAAYRQLRQEKEIACDERASRLTHRPLALASALAKVWQHSIEGPHFNLAQPLVGANEAIDNRIQRLLNRTEPAPRSERARFVVLSISVVTPVLLAIAVLISVGCILVLMQCHPLVLIQRFFF